MQYFSFTLLATLGYTALAFQPVAYTTNGTFGGLYIPEFKQNVFLGIPYAEPPIGHLRFARPQSYNGSWSGIKSAKSYGSSCYGFGSFSDGFEFSEDCLTLNVVVPAVTYENDGNGSWSEDNHPAWHDPAYKTFETSNQAVLNGICSGENGVSSSGKPCQEPLPVFVWIHGGGFIGGGSADPRYNLSYLVQTSVAMGKPMIGVSLNYRLTGFGFLSGGDISAESANQALLDQRLALRWISENIAAFGGDPRKVTIAGESAGGWSVGYQLIAYGGDNEGLFRSAMVQSGTMYGKRIHSYNYYTKRYNELVELTSCSNADNKLDCLRAVPAQKLFDIFVETSAKFFWDPTVDGNFLPEMPYKLMESGKFAKVALLTGTTMDECTIPTHGPRGFFNTTEQLRDFLISGSEYDPGYRVLSPLLSAVNADRVLDIYPDDPDVGCPYKTGSTRFEELGYQFKRGASIIGDWLMQAGRRHLAQQYSAAHQSVYSFHFEQPPWDGIETGVSETPPVGVAHFTEVAYIFGIPDPTLVNWIGPDPGYQDLSKLMSRMWVSFVTNQDPNFHEVTEFRVPQWPLYQPVGGENMIFKANDTHVEADNFRVDGLKFWADTWAETTSSRE